MTARTCTECQRTARRRTSPTCSLLCDARRFYRLRLAALEAAHPGRWDGGR